MGLLLLGKGGVWAHRFERPLAAELDESEQWPRREAGEPARYCLTRVRTSPPVRTARSLGTHAVVRVEAEVAPAFREEASVSRSTTIEFLASFWRVGARDLAS
jgi:hypothetical protein